MKKFFAIKKREIITTILTFKGDTADFIQNLIFIGKLWLKPPDKDYNRLLICLAKDFNHGRYGFQLLNYFSNAGYQVIIYRSFLFLLNLREYDKMIFKIPGLSIWGKKTIKDRVSKSTLLLTVNRTTDLHNIIEKHFVLDIDVFNSGKFDIGNIFYFPYYVHPLLHNQIEVLHKKKIIKSGGVLFYGSKELLCDSKWIRGYFNKLSRAEVLQALLKSELPILAPKTIEELNTYLDQGCEDKIVFIDSTLIWLRNWLDILKRFHFFVATPGYTMPMCHNIIEAMGVCVIPIFEYPELFHPILIDNENCIIFNSPVSLINRISESLKMTVEQREIIRKNVEKYYDENICPVNLRKKIEFLKSGRYQLKFNAEQLSLSKVSLSNNIAEDN